MTSQMGGKNQQVGNPGSSSPYEIYMTICDRLLLGVRYEGNFSVWVDRVEN